jgi:hypothetical protein
MRIFFHQAIYFMFGNRKKSRGLNLENTVDVAAIRSPIPPISLSNEGSVCRRIGLVEQYFLFRQVGPFFLQYIVKCAQ